MNIGSCSAVSSSIPKNECTFVKYLLKAVYLCCIPRRQQLESAFSEDEDDVTQVEEDTIGLLDHPDHIAQITQG